MCFSAEASFAGGVLISAIGYATVRKVHNRKQILFASIPLFFGLQQIAEGILWVALTYPEYFQLQEISTIVFISMAYVIWPLMIPLAVLLMEEDRKRKKELWVLLIIGIAVSIYYAVCMVMFTVEPQIMAYHIHYNTHFPEALNFPVFLVYLIATIPPLFISSIKKTHLMGWLMLLSCLITIVFYKEFMTSVWCFFAALLSIIVFWILHDSKKAFDLDKLLKLREKVGL